VVPLLERTTHADLNRDGSEVRSEATEALRQPRWTERLEVANQPSEVVLLLRGEHLDRRDVLSPQAKDGLVCLRAVVV
jgi:hypothetical protein